MADTITLPQLGKVKKEYVYAGGALIIGIVGYAYWKRNSNKKVADTGFDPNAIDPLTGLPYSAELGTGSGSYSNPNPNASGSDVVDNTNQIKTNSDWALAVTDKLGNLGYDPGFVSSVLGKYLGAQALTSDEASLVRTAWAYQGHPPEDRQIILVTTGPAPGGGGSGGGDNNPPPSSPAYQSVKAGWLVDQWIMDLQKGYGDQGGNPNVTYDQLVAWNPSFNSNINWKGGAGAGNTFKAAATYRIR